jgi:hypothetical protein
LLIQFVVSSIAFSLVTLTRMEESTSEAVSAIIESFQEQMRRMDDLEVAMDARAVRARRRMTTLLEQQTPQGSHPMRNSHVRMWVTHQHKPASTVLTAPVNDSCAFPTETIVPERYTVQVEGSLLIGNLDHSSAADYDRRTGYVAPTDDLDRSRGEKEDDVPVPAYHLTHLFSKLVAEFQSVYQPKINPMARIVTHPPVKKKKSGRRSSGAPDNLPGGTAGTVVLDDVDFSKCLLSKRQPVTWTRESAEDAHAWAVQYEPPNVQGFDVHSVVCRIRLFGPGSGSQPRYTICNATAVQHLFPYHGPPPPTRDELQYAAVRPQQQQHQQQTEGNTASSSSSKTKRKLETDTTADGYPWPPVDYEIHLSASLTMSEIVQTFFVYLTDHQLMDPDEKSTIICDAVLKTILGVERLPFHQLQATLLRQTIIALDDQPAVQATYIMRRDTAQNYMNRTASLDPSNLAGPAAAAALWQWDMEVPVPQLFDFRVRELLRRIKRRELEYTSARTKARYLLAARRMKDEDVIRNQIELVVSSKLLAPAALQPVMLALAKAAPPQTQARTCALADAQISYLLEQLPQHCRAALEAQELLEACLAIGEVSSLTPSLS